MVKNSDVKLKKVHFIINPASGRMEPILPVINEVMAETGIDWDVSITKKAGDGTRLARALVDQNVDLIAVYGGDGTLMEVITGMTGSGVPLGILPGGTGNVLATELGIPGNIKEGCLLITEGPSELRAIDLGQFNKRFFTQRTSYGYETEMVKGAKRKTKNRFGRLAYFLSSMGALQNLKIADYDVLVDGQKHHEQGITCIVANSGNMGFSSKFTLDKTIDVSDGLLDVLVVKKAHPGLLKYLYKNLTRGDPPEDHELVAHWQGRDVKVSSRPHQVVQCDGEVLGKVPIHAKVIPHAIEILVPKKISHSLKV
jgi:diacylglycerol kinase (ATP)